MENFSNEPTQQIRCIIRSTKQRERRVSITKYSKIEIPPECFFRYVVAKAELSHVEWKSIDYSPQLEELFIQFEQKTMQSTKFKVGVLYRKKGQKTEEQFYSNDPSPEFENFMNCIGDKIELLGWNKFSGGLDIKSRQTGDFSWYSNVKHTNYEIIFHSSVHLPKLSKDPQQTDRKRHVGNDLVVIVYDESGESFNPTWITSKVSHSFIIVRPFELNGPKPSYVVAVANRAGLTSFGPPCPQNLVKGELMREWFHTKIVNAERTIITSSLFKQRLAKTRGLLLQEIMEKIVGVNPNVQT